MTTVKMVSLLLFGIAAMLFLAITVGIIDEKVFEIMNLGFASFTVATIIRNYMN